MNPFYLFSSGTQLLEVYRVIDADPGMELFTVEQLVNKGKTLTVPYYKTFTYYTVRLNLENKLWDISQNPPDKPTSS